MQQAIALSTKSYPKVKYTDYFSKKWVSFISNKLSLDAYVIMYQSVIHSNAVCKPSDYGFETSDDIFEVIKLRVMAAINRESINSVYHNVEQIKQDLYKLLYDNLLKFDINRLNKKGTTTKFFTYFTNSIINMRRDLSHWKVTSKYQTVYDAYSTGKGKVCFIEDQLSNSESNGSNELAGKAYDTSLIESLAILDNCKFLTNDERIILDAIIKDSTVIKQYNSNVGGMISIDWKYLSMLVNMPVHKIRRILATSIKSKLNTSDYYPSLDSQIEAVMDSEAEVVVESLDDFIQSVVSLDILLSNTLHVSYASSRNIMCG